MNQVSHGPIPKSGLYYPNKIARIALTAIEDVMGKNGLNAILNLAESYRT